MQEKDLEQLKKEYLEMPIPRELDFRVKKALQDSGVKYSQKNNRFKGTKVIAASVLVLLTILAIGVNTSPGFAQSMAKVPIVGHIIKIITLREYSVDEEDYMADIKVPAISGLENKTLENSLNEKYLAENKELYEQFMADVGDLSQKGEAHLGVSSGYEIKTENDRIFSIGRYVVTVAGSSDTQIKYDTIDKKKQVSITLPSLFKDDRYIDVISQSIIKQMREEMKSDSAKVYWIDDQVEPGFVDPFQRISKEQSFYINQDSKLVISFDKYEIAPGCMGNPEFIIPSQVISDVLVGIEYIK